MLSELTSSIKVLQVSFLFMIKRFKKGFMRHYRIVKKFSDMLEARLSEEVLNLYHIQTVIVKNVQEVYLLVLPQDYHFAHRLLYSR